MEQKQLKYTIKIYGEGYTEWFYFDYLRVNNKFKFTVEPEMPNASKSSYKKRLKEIDKELKKREEERANAIFLITDLDNIKNNKKEFEEYLAKKEIYKRKGVLFIESHPCIEIWFLYHFWEKFNKTNFLTYDDVKKALKEFLPSYDKTEHYYRNNKQLRDAIMQNTNNRKNAIINGIQSCKYEPVKDEICNFSEMFKAIHFFRLLKKFCELDSLLKEEMREAINLSIDIVDHKSVRIYKEKQEICLFKYDNKGKLKMIVNNIIIEIQDETPLIYSKEYIDPILDIIRKDKIKLHNTIKGHI